jgi:hypothetical protein
MEPSRCRAAWIALFLAAIAASRVHAQIHFDDFTSSEGLSLVGDVRVSGKVLRITPAREEKAGALWFRDKQSVGSGFETTFRFQLTHHDRVFYRGVDGFAFVVQNSGPDADQIVGPGAAIRQGGDTLEMQAAGSGHQGLRALAGDERREG